MKLELFGAWEAADFFGVSKQALFHWRKNDPLFPDPEIELRSGPVWTRAQLEEYKLCKIGKVGRLNLTDVRRMLELCAEQFEFYAEMHQAKTSFENLSEEKISQTLEKEQVNREMVAKIRAVLRGETPEGLHD